LKLFSSIFFVLILASCAVSSNFSSAARVPFEKFKVELSSRVVKDGSVVLLQLLNSEENLSLDNLKVFAEFEGKKINLYKEGRAFKVLIGVPYRYSKKNMDIKVSAHLGKQKNSWLVQLDVKRRKYIKESLKVDSSRVSPPKKVLNRIFSEGREIRKIYNKVTHQKHWGSHFVLPVKNKITSHFGTQRLFNGKMKSFHKGVDLRAGVGDPIHAPAAGIITLSKDLYYTGNTVMIDHGYGLITLYAHMSKLKVKKNERVKQGQVLGLAGMTGRVSGPHLHWGAVIHQEKVNPMDLIKVFE